MHLESFNVPKQHVSYMIPSTFQEVIVRIFTRHPEKTPAIQRAFRRLLSKVMPASALKEPNLALELPKDYDMLLGKRRRSASAQSLGSDIVKKWEPSQ